MTLQKIVVFKHDTQKNVGVRTCNKSHQQQSLRHQRRGGGELDKPSRASLVFAFWNPLIAIVCLSLASHQIQVAEALTCYETINGKTAVVQNDSWTYCALVPATVHNTERGKEVMNGTQFGLGPENDLLAAYNTAFGMSVDEYRILTVCIFERYDFGRFMTLRPDSSMVEFAFRCVCNYDLCNSEPTFSGYLSAIKTESFARR